MREGADGRFAIDERVPVGFLRLEPVVFGDLLESNSQQSLYHSVPRENAGPLVTKDLYLLMVDRRVNALQAYTLIHLAVAGALVAGLVQLMAEPSSLAAEAQHAFNWVATSGAFGLVTTGLLLGIRFRAANIVAEISEPDIVRGEATNDEVLIQTRRRLDWGAAMAASGLQVGALIIALLLFRAAVVA